MLVITTDFMVHIRVMVHTLTEHISAYFPNPWGTPALDTNHDTDDTSVSEILQLTGELEYVWHHAQKLLHQVYRSHRLLQTGKIKIM